MKTHRCPDCQTGWRYAEDMPDRRLHPHRHGLVQCPTCNGTGRVVGQDRKTVSFSWNSDGAAHIRLVPQIH